MWVPDFPFVRLYGDVMAEEEKNEVQEVQPQAVQEQGKKPSRLGPPNLCKKYNISQDDYFAVIERLVKYILDTYNFGSELVTIMVLDQLRNGDIPREIERVEKTGIYRR